MNIEQRFFTTSTGAMWTASQQRQQNIHILYFKNINIVCIPFQQTK